MTSHETPAVKAERERREDQDALWDKARYVANQTVEQATENNWLTTTDFVNKIQTGSGVSRYVAVAVIQELRDAGKVAYSMKHGYRNASIPVDKGIELITRPEDIKRRNDFLEFLTQIQAR